LIRALSEARGTAKPKVRGCFLLAKTNESLTYQSADWSPLSRKRARAVVN
jgi:hypothetical protein